MTKSIINFDYNATAPLLPMVHDRCLKALELQGNPSSIHQQGRNVRHRLEEARQQIKDALGLGDRLEPCELVFTSGATEANTMVISMFEGPVLVCADAHPSILEARQDAIRAPVDEHGIVSLSFVEDWLKLQTKQALVAVMAANNETGVLQPIVQVAALCLVYSARFHCDAVQALGRLPLDFKLFDSVAISAHKIGGLMGVGALIIRDDFMVQPLIRGGAQEKYRRSGTENVIGCLAFAPAVQHAMSTASMTQWQHVDILRQKMEDELLLISPSSTIFGSQVSRLPNTTMITMPGVTATTQVMRFDLDGVCVSAGSACSSGKVKRSHVLASMGVSDDSAETALRISLSPSVTKQQIDTFVDLWKQIYYSINNAAQNGAQ